MSTLQVATIQTNTPAGVLAVRDSNDALTSIQPSALRGTAVLTAPVFQDSAGTPIGILCRAWVNFNGVGTVAIRQAFNVSSITDNGTGDYTVNFTNPMPTANYAAAFSVNDNTNNAVNVATLYDTSSGGADPTVNAIRFCTVNSGATGILDVSRISAAIFT